MRLKGGSLRGYPFPHSFRTLAGQGSAGESAQFARLASPVVLQSVWNWIGHAVKKGNCRGHEAAQFTRRIGGSV
jgi:hypothetical protein